MPALIKKRTKDCVLSPLERKLKKDGFLVELDRIMTCKEFYEERFHDDILAEMPAMKEYFRKQKRIKSLKTNDMAPEISVLFNNPVLTTEQEQHVFRKYNLLKYKAKKLLDCKNNSSFESDIYDLMKQAIVVRNFIAVHNMRLAISVSKNFSQAISQTNDSLWNIVAEANLCVLKSIRCFDFNLNFKFSTYVTWAIRNNLSRICKNEYKYHNRFASGHDSLFFDRPCEDEGLPEIQDRQLFLKKVVDGILEKLDERERTIVHKYIIEESHSLDDLGEIFGITKERVRQIKAKSIKNMKEMFTNGEVSLNGFLEEFISN